MDPNNELRELIESVENSAAINLGTVIGALVFELVELRGYVEFIANQNASATSREELQRLMGEAAQRMAQRLRGLL